MLNVTDKNFVSEVLSTTGVTLVDFWAPWCMPCRMLSPIIDRIDKEYQGKVKVVKVNVDENIALSSQYEIMAIPTMIIFRNGKEYKRISGVVPERNIKELLDQALAS